MTEVWSASVSWSIWEGNTMIGVGVDKAAAQKICEARHGSPLDWSDPTLGGLFDASPDVMNAEGSDGGTYSIRRYEVQT